MAAPTSDPLREFVDTRSEVLSDSTDLDVLLAAILDDESTPALVKAWPRPATEARPEPTLATPPPVAPAPDRDFSTAIGPASDVDAGNEPFMGFLPESEQESIRGQDEAVAVAEFAPLVATPLPSKGWRELPVPTARQLLLVAGFATGFVALGVAYFRADPGDSLNTQSLAATVPAPAAPIVEPPAATPPVAPTATAPAPAPSDAADATPTREPAKPRVITTPPARRASDRTNPVQAPTQSSVVPSSSTASAGASTAVPRPVADEANGGRAPVPIAPPVVDAPKPPSSPAVPETVAPTLAASTAEPVVTAAALPVPAGVERATPARLLTGGVPGYPPALRTARVGGNVEVRFTIDSSGRVTNARSVTGPAQLRSVAEAAVRRWRYEPAHRGNVAIDTETSVNFNFDPWAKREPQQ